MMVSPHLKTTNQSKMLSQLLPGIVLSDDQKNLQVTAVTADSRQVTSGGLFLAYPGAVADGRCFVGQAVAAGAVAVVAESQNLTPDTCEQPVPVIPVAGLAQQVSAIAGYFYDQPASELQLTGITGTNGKTTCSQLLAQLQQRLWQRRGSDKRAGFVGTLGYGLANEAPVTTGMTTPDAVNTQAFLAELRDSGAATVAMEVSSHSLVQGRVAALPFHTAIFTNLSRDHLDYHGDMASYLAAKGLLFQCPDIEVAVLNGDDPASENIAALLAPSVAVYRFFVNRLVTDPKHDIAATDVRLSAVGIEASLTTPWGAGELKSPLLGSFNLSNLLAVVAAACGQGWPLQDVLQELSQLTPVAGRMQLVNTHLQLDADEPAIVVDYAHTPDALEKALHALRSHCTGKLWCVFGCGGDRDSGKRPQMGVVAARLADCPVVTSDNPRSENPDQIILDILAHMPDSAAVRVAPDRAAAIREAIACAAYNDCVLIAGKGHENYQEVNGERLPFDDVEQATQVLRERAEKQPVESFSEKALLEQSLPKDVSQLDSKLDSKLDKGAGPDQGGGYEH